MNDKVLDHFKQQSIAAGVVPADVVIPSFTAPRPKGPVARVFPRDVRDALVAASQVERFRGPGESKARTLAVDAAVRRARRSCPGLFINDKE